MITNKNILDFEKRGKIYQFILKNPGLHLRELERKSKIPKSTLVHHLKFLEKRELVKSTQDKRFTRYYVTKRIGKREKEILSTIRQDVPFKIILHVLHNYVTSRKEMSKELEKHPNTISFHFKKLLEKDIIERSPVINGMGSRPIDKRPIRIDFINRNQIIYRLKDPYEIYDVLIANQENIFKKNRNFDNLMLWNLNVNYPTYTPPEVANDFESGVDSSLDAFFEVFPHPYHV